MKRDIENRADIELLVNEFYRKVTEDDVIGFIFSNIVKMNWEKHLPIMYDFWDNALFFTGTYSGNPMNLHKHLHHIRPLDSKHFSRWVDIFLETVDDNFEGEKASLARQRAISIAAVMEEKILQYRIEQHLL
ncbi:MAG: group III truncated hemoglobin [Chitinophagaceae bacterium]|nr:MAG: group III truncated hemoglobin [Chitinophagaceae bacterium]